MVVASPRSCCLCSKAMSGIVAVAGVGFFRVFLSLSSSAYCLPGISPSKFSVTCPGNSGEPSLPWMAKTGHKTLQTPVGYCI